MESDDCHMDSEDDIDPWPCELNSDEELEVAGIAASIVAQQKDSNLYGDKDSKSPSKKAGKKKVPQPSRQSNRIIEKVLDVKIDQEAAVQSHEQQSEKKSTTPHKRKYNIVDLTTWVESDEEVKQVNSLKSRKQASEISYRLSPREHERKESSKQTKPSSLVLYDQSSISADIGGTSKSKPVARVAPLSRTDSTMNTFPITKSQAKTLAHSLKSALQNCPREQTNSKSKTRGRPSKQQSNGLSGNNNKSKRKRGVGTNKRHLNIITPDRAEKTVAQVVLWNMNDNQASPGKEPITKNRSITFTFDTMSDDGDGKTCSSTSHKALENEIIPTTNQASNNFSTRSNDSNSPESEVLVAKCPERTYCRDTTRKGTPSQTKTVSSAVGKHRRGRPKKGERKVQKSSKPVITREKRTRSCQETRLSVSSQMKFRSVLQQSFTKIRHSSSLPNSPEKPDSNTNFVDMDATPKKDEHPRVWRQSTKSSNLDKIIANLSQKAEVVKVISPTPMSPIVKLECGPSRSSKKSRPKKIDKSSEDLSSSPSDSTVSDKSMKLRKRNHPSTQQSTPAKKPRGRPKKIRSLEKPHQEDTSSIFKPTNHQARRFLVAESDVVIKQATSTEKTNNHVKRGPGRPRKQKSRRGRKKIDVK